MVAWLASGLLYFLSIPPPQILDANTISDVGTWSGSLFGPPLRNSLRIQSSSFLWPSTCVWYILDVCPTVRLDSPLSTSLAPSSLFFQTSKPKQ